MLPIEDYDRLLVRELRTRVQDLPADAVAQLLSHERQHAARPVVLDLLQERLADPAPGTGPGGPADGPALQDQTANPRHRDTALGVQRRIAQPPKAAR